jgi:SAM-dependent methyltransferase
MTGEICLVQEVVAAMDDGPTRILNLGAGRSPWVEYQIGRRRGDFLSDRVDVEDPTVAQEHVSYTHLGRCWTASIDAMPQVPSNAYGVACANYVLEHVHDLDAVIREIRRVLRPGGVFVMAVPNPSALPGRLAAITPLWFHRLVLGRRSWHTVYAYRTLDELATVFERHGFEWRAVYRISNLAAYLSRLPVVRDIGRLYDWLVIRLKLTILMGDGCLVCVAPSEADAVGGSAGALRHSPLHPSEQLFTCSDRPPWPR